MSSLTLIPSLGDIVGLMLDPDIRVVDALGRGARVGHEIRERYVQDGDSRALETQPSVFYAESQGRSRTTVNRTEVDRGPVTIGPIGFTDALLCPISLPIWGRREDEFVLDAVVGPSDEIDSGVVVSLRSRRGGVAASSPATITVDARHGFLWQIVTPDLEWVVTSVVLDEIGPTIEDFTRAASMKGLFSRRSPAANDAPRGFRGGS